MPTSVRSRHFRPLALGFTALALACSSGGDQKAAAPQGSLAGPVPGEGLAAIDTTTFMEHMRVLSADSLLGRLPGSLGEERTVAYLEGQFKAIGLAAREPGRDLHPEGPAGGDHRAGGAGVDP